MILPVASKLKDLLGAETPSGWIRFMDAVHAEFPFLFNDGRPPKKDIENSEIGRAGYSSWGEYINKELEWNESQWRAWMRAYKVLLEFEYLRELELTASAINTAKQRAGKMNQPFPATRVEFLELKDAAAAEVERKREESMAQLKRDLEAVTEERDYLLGQVQAFNKLPWYKKLFFSFSV